MFLKNIILIFIITMIIGCSQKTFTEKMEEIKKEKRNLEQLNRFNVYINNKYKGLNDIDVYGVKDYYASVEEFEKNGGGDCEDFSIYKYKKLINNLNYKETDFKFTLVKYYKYKNPKKYDYHLLLEYNDKLNNDYYYLDNLNRYVLLKKDFKDKKYEYVETFEWKQIENMINKRYK